MKVFSAILASIFIVQASGEFRWYGTLTLIRHGDTQPVFMDMNAPYQTVQEWPTEKDQLTIRGMKQMYSLGVETRKSMSYFLSELYNPNEVRVMSTRTERTIMSAETFLAGLYPVKESKMFKNDLAWRPAPVYMLPISEDPFLSVTRRCPKQLKLIDEFTKTENFTNFIKHYDWVRLYIQNNTNFNIDPIFLADLTYIYQALQTEVARRKPYAVWFLDIFPRDLFEIAKFTFNMLTRTPELARLMAGEAVKKITEDLIAMDTNKIPQRVLVYSVHDITIHNLLIAMDLFKNSIPPPGAWLRFELQREGNLTLITAGYNEGSYHRFITFHGFGYRIPISEFKKRYQPLFIENRTKECFVRRNRKNPPRKIPRLAMKVASIKKRSFILRST